MSIVTADAGRPTEMRPRGQGDTSLLQVRIDRMQSSRLTSAPAWPALPALAPLLPGGVLRQGATYAVDESVVLASALMAGAVAAGAWCALVGWPHIGAEAAEQAGLALDRLILVPEPGEHWLQVTAALVDVLGVVVLRSPPQVRAADADRLTARLRHRPCTLIVLGDWPPCEARLRVEGSWWSGLGNGHGYLTSRRISVAATSRTGRTRHGRLVVPDLFHPGSPTGHSVSGDGASSDLRSETARLEAG